METEPLPGAVSLEPGDDEAAWLKGAGLAQEKPPLPPSAPSLVLFDLQASSSLAASAVLPPLPAAAESPPALVESPPALVDSPPALVDSGPALVDSPPLAAPVQHDRDTDDIVTRAEIQTLLRAARQQEQILEELSELRSLIGQLRLCQTSSSNASTQT